MMKVVDHGKWIPYKPAVLPEGAPANALFAKRESDGVDWYEYVNPPKKNKARLFSENFREDSVKIAFCFHEAEKKWIIGPACIDPTMIFPANHYVREILDFPHSRDLDAIIDAFRNKLIDPETSELLGDRKQFMPELTPEQQTMRDLPQLVSELIKRMDKLEDRLK